MTAELEFGATGNDTLAMTGIVTASGGLLRNVISIKTSITGGTGLFLGATGNLILRDPAKRTANVWVPHL